MFGSIWKLVLEREIAGMKLDGEMGLSSNGEGKEEEEQAPRVMRFEPRISLQPALDSGVPVDGMSAPWRSPQRVVELAWKRSSSTSDLHGR